MPYMLAMFTHSTKGLQRNQSSTTRWLRVFSRAGAPKWELSIALKEMTEAQFEPIVDFILEVSDYQYLLIVL